jgi:site-specific recombinase XerD
MRHTYATTLLANGCPMDYIKVLLGHSKVETTARYYAAVEQKHAEEAHYRFLSYERRPSFGPGPAQPLP